MNCVNNISQLSDCGPHGQLSPGVKMKHEHQMSESTQTS